MSADTPVLDVTCGTRAMWFDKLDPRAIMCDQRAEAITVTDRSHGRQDGTRTLTIDPDIQCDFRELPFPDATFRLVVFDPPHLVRAGRRSWLAVRYGRLGDSWRDDLRQGFAECFRVLMPGGVLIFKWSEVQVPLRDVLALTPERPLFGHPTGKSTHWVAFIAPDGTPVYSGEPIGAMDYEYDGPFAPVLDADGQPVVRTVGDLTARHQLARSRIRVAGREGKLKIVKPSDAYPGTVTLIWGDWWEDAALEEPCEVLP